MAKKKQTGLGKGLDSLIPDFYNEDFDSNHQPSLEDLLNEDTDEEVKVEEKDPVEEEIVEEKEEVVEVKPQEEPTQDKELSNRDLENIEEVKEIVEKNPRITLWSSQSAAVFRYLRKTEPEFSISKEASVLIDEAVSKKYPDIWKLFDGI